MTKNILEKNGMDDVLSGYFKKGKTKFNEMYSLQISNLLSNRRQRAEEAILFTAANNAMVLRAQGSPWPSAHSPTLWLRETSPWLERWCKLANSFSGLIR